jgi:hypothetical protein
MQGRVREGGDHLAALERRCKGCTSSLRHRTVDGRKSPFLQENRSSRRFDGSFPRRSHDFRSHLRTNAPTTARFSQFANRLFVPATRRHRPPRRLRGIGLRALYEKVLDINPAFLLKR